MNDTPGKLRRLPGRRGLYYRRKSGKVRYGGKRYQKYSLKIDLRRYPPKNRRPRRKYAHEGDRPGKRA